MTLTATIVQERFALLAADRRASRVGPAGEVLGWSDDGPKLTRTPTGWTAGTGGAELAGAGSSLLSQLPGAMDTADIARGLLSLTHSLRDALPKANTRACWPTVTWAGGRLLFTVYEADGTLTEGGVGARWVTWPHMDPVVIEDLDKRLQSDVEGLAGPALVRRVAQLFVEASAHSSTVAGEIDVGIIALDPVVSFRRLEGSARDLIRATDAEIGERNSTAREA